MTRKPATSHAIEITGTSSITALDGPPPPVNCIKIIGATNKIGDAITVNGERFVAKHREGDGIVFWRDAPPDGIEAGRVKLGKPKHPARRKRI